MEIFAFNFQPILISAVVVVVMICGLLFGTLWFSSNRQKKGYQEISDFLTKLEENLTKNLPVENEEKTFAIKIFTPEIEKFVLPKTELPKKDLKNSLVLIESFIDAKKSKEVVETTEGIITFIDQNLIIKAVNQEFKIDLNHLFYVAGFYDLQNKVLLLSLVDYEQQKSFKFQFLYFEDLAFFNQIIYQYKTRKDHLDDRF